MSENPGSAPPPNENGKSGETAPALSPVARLRAAVRSGVGHLGAALRDLRGGIIEFLKGPFGFYAHLSRALASADRPTRRMAWLFVFAQLGLLAVISVAIVKIAENRQEAFQKLSAEQAENVARLVEKKHKASEAKNTTLRLGSFEVAMTDVPGSKRLPGVVNMAELEIVVQCDSKEACDYLETNIVRTKDLVAQLLVPMDREDLLSVDGKERLKSTISERLNAWLPSGEVRKVFFSRVLID